MTTLAAGVSYIFDPDLSKTNPEPDEPTPTDGRLAFVLPSIPAFGQISMRLVVDVPSGTTTIDDGARVFGNIRTRAVKASVGATTLPATLGVSDDYLRSTIDANSSDRYVLETIGRIGCDPIDLFEYVRDDIGYEVYRGSLRGARGTLWSKAGNALDQSSLLIAMLRACGVPARYVSGTLAIPEAQDLILSMFPPITRAVGGLPPADLPQLGNVDINDLLLNASQFLPGADQISDPANDPELLSEAQDHFWVQYHDGSSFMDLDGSFANAAVDQTFTTSESDFVEVNDAIRHKVRFELVGETVMTGAGGLLLNLAADLGTPQTPNMRQRVRRVGSHSVIEESVLDETLRTVEVVGEPVSFGQFVDQFAFGGIINTYSPWMQIGDREHLHRGIDFQEMYGFIGSNVLSGYFLRIKVLDALAKDQDYERTLLDRIGFAVRQEGGPSDLGNPSGTPAFTELDCVSVAVAVSAHDHRSADRDARHAAKLLTEFDAATDSSIPDKSLMARLGRGATLARAAAIGSSFYLTSNRLTADIQKLTSTRSFLSTPAFSILHSSFIRTPIETRHFFSLDLRKNDIRTIVAYGQPMVAAFIYRLMYGLVQTTVEDSVLGASGQHTGAATVISAASTIGTDLVAFGSWNISQLDDVPISPEARARIRDALLSNHIVLVPAHMVDVAGRETVAWIEVNPLTGDAIGVSENGDRQGQLEYAILLVGRFVAIGQGIVDAVAILKTVLKQDFSNFSKELRDLLLDALCERICAAKGVVSPEGLVLAVQLCLTCHLLKFAYKLVDPPLAPFLSDPPESSGSSTASSLPLAVPGNLGLVMSLSATDLKSQFYRVHDHPAVASDTVLALYPSATEGIAVSKYGDASADVSNFDSTFDTAFEQAILNLDIVEGALALGGSVVEGPVNVGLAIGAGLLRGFENGDHDSVDLNLTFDRLVFASVSSEVVTAADSNGAVVDVSISSNVDDTYVLTVEAPELWHVDIAAGGTTRIVPRVGAPAGTYETRVTVISQTTPGLTASTRVFVVVPVPGPPSITVTVLPDSDFNVPNEGTLTWAAYRIEVSNGSTATDTVDVEISGLAETDFTQAVPWVMLTPGDTGVVGVAVHPVGGLLPPGASIEFRVTVTGRVTGLTDFVDVSIPYPQVVGVRPSFAPGAIATRPDTILMVDLVLTAAGNVESAFTLDVDDADLDLSNLPPAASVMPGQTLTIPMTVVVPPDVPVGTTIPVTVTADLCSGADPCMVPLPSQRFASLAVLIGSPEASCVLADAVAARDLDLDELAAALEGMGHAFSRLSLDRTDVLLQGRAVASGNAVVALLRDAGRTALADDLETLLAEIASGDDTQIQAALANACTVLAPLNGELNAIASERDHGFRIDLAPSARSVAANEPAEFALRLESIGTLDSTINFSVPGLPPGVTAQFSQSSVVIEPKQVIDRSSGTPVTVTLTSTAPLVGSLPFSVNAQVAEAPTIIDSANGLLRNSAVDVVAVRPVPQVVNPAGTPVAVSAELLNSANVARSVNVALRVENSIGTVVFMGTPTTVALATGSETTPVDLGSVDTTGFADDTFTAIVTAQNADGTPLPGRQGRGSFIIGLPVVASASVEPAVVPPGGAEHVVSKVRVQARASVPPGAGFHDQSAKAVAASSLTTAPTEALGFSDDRMAVVSAGGSLLLDMGADLDRIADGPGVDLVVFERDPAASNPIDANGCFQAGLNAYQVDVSEDANGPFTPLGTVSGQRETGDELDLGRVGLLSARYVRITPVSASVSIDAVLAAHTHHPGGIQLNHIVPIGADEGVVHPPTVGDIDGDAVPDIIFVSDIFFTQCDVIAIDGQTGAEKWRYPLPFGHAGVVNACGNLNQPAIADMDTDGVPEIVINRSASGAFGAGGPLIYIFKNDGTLLHQYLPGGGSYSPALENLVGDARPEILVRGGYLDGDGTPHQFLFVDEGIAVDVDGDATQELVVTLPIDHVIRAIRPDGSIVWSRAMPGSPYSKFSVADLDRDGLPELVGSVQNVNDRAVYVLEHDGTLGWRHDFPPIAGNCTTTQSQSCQTNGDCPAGESCLFPGGLLSHVSRPSIADLNNDGRPEIAVVVNNIGVDHRDYVVALDAEGTELWRTEARDPIGAAGGVSTADLDGDGAAEVLWNGYCSGFTIFDGRTGSVLYRDPRVHSISAFDYPVTADSDADGHLDVITGDTDGLYVFSDTAGWRAGRSIWNQGDYRVTNINDDLTVPAVQPESWKWHNTYLSQSVVITDPAEAEVTIDHLLAAGVTINPGDIDPPAATITGQTIHWTSPPFALSMGDTFSAGVDLPALNPGQSHVVSESTTVNAILNFLSGQTGSTSLTLDPVTVYAPHIIAVEPEIQEAAPGTTAVFSVRVQNLRSVPETFTLSVVGVDPASVTLPAPIPLAADSEAVVPVSLAVSPSSAAGLIAFSVVATGDQGTLDEAGAEIDVRGSLASGLHVEVVPVNDVAGQGTAGLFRIVVTNTGNSTQTVQLSASLPPGLSADFERSLISVPPGLTGSRETVVSLSVTPGTAAEDAVFTITATSTSDPDLTATAQGTLSIQPTGVAIDLRPDSVQVTPQDGALFTALITNTGTSTDTFLLNLAGPVANFASFTTPSVLLQPGASISVPITVGSLEAFLLQRTFLIAQVHSLTDPLVQATDAAVIDVGAFRAVTAAFESGSTATGCSVSTDLALLITNAGNAGDERYTITFNSVPAGVTLTPVTTQFLVPPLKTARIPIAVAPPGTGTFDITATVSTLGDPLCIVPPCAPLPGATTNTAVELTTVVDGASCSDANACTHTDTCVNGACVGSPVDCSQTDECHDAGICDPLSGCPNASADGTACDDSSVCTSGDTCQAGACVGTSTVSCGPCETCDPILGICTNACPPTPTTTPTAEPTSTPSPAPAATSTATGTPTPTPGLDHFECHKARLESGPASFVPIPNLSLIDHFGPLTVDVRAPQRLCNPTDKNDEDPSAPTHPEHLTSYKIKRAAGAARFVKVRNQIVADQFGSLAVDVIKPRQLLVPSAKSLISSPPQITDPFTDHFTCYKVRLAEGAPAFNRILGVTLEDQFGPTTVDIVKPVALCAPTNKAGEDPNAPTHPGFLTCYKVKAVPGSPRFSPLTPVFVNNQFGPASLKVSKTKDLCLPSALNPTPTGTPTATVAGPTSTASMTPTRTPTADGTATATGTPLPTRTRTPSMTPSVTPTPTHTGTATPTSGDVLDTILIGGPPVTVTIAQPGQIGRLVFGGSAGQRITLTKSGIPGTIQILKPDGSTLASSSSTFIDTQTLTASGLHTIVFTPSGGGTGSATFQLFDVPPDVAGEIGTDGVPVDVVIPVPGRNARLTFDGTTGQRVSLHWVPDSIPFCCANALKIENPDGSIRYTADFNGVFLVEPLALSQTGTHAITFDPAGSNTGVVTLSLTTVTDSTGSVPLDGSTQVITLNDPGQNAIRTFTGTAGQRIGVTLVGSSFGTLGRFRMRGPAPGNTLLVDEGLFGQFRELTLAQSGTYTLEFNPGQTETGTIILTVLELIDIMGTITPGGPPVTVTIPEPGLRARLSFAGTTGQRVSLVVTNTTLPFGAHNVRVEDPNGMIVDSLDFLQLGTGTYLEPMHLSQDGTYSVVVDPNSGDTGDLTVRLDDVVDITGVMPIGGPPTDLTFTSVGQIATLTFSGSAGQHIGIVTGNVTTGTFFSGTILTITNPDDSVLGSSQMPSHAMVFSAPLTQTGTYEIRVDPEAFLLGTVPITLVLNITGPIVSGDPPLQLNFTQAHQVGRFSFDGIAGESATVTISNNLVGFLTASIRNPDGGTLISRDTNGALTFGVVMTQTGSHTLLIDPHSTNTGGVDVALVTAPCPVPSITVSPSSVAAGGSVTATWSGICLPTSTDWVGRFTPGAVNTAYLNYVYTNGAASGSLSFPIPPGAVPGTYELRLFPNDTYNLLATSDAFTVVGP